MNNKDIVLTKINDTKDELKIFKDELKSKKEKLPDIRAIAASLNTIKKTIDEINKLCDDKTKVLETIIQNLNYAQIKELLNKTDIMFDVINDNLPNGMELKTIPKHDERDIEKIREIWFENSKVGKVKILDEVREMLYIEVSINNSVDKFEVMMPNRMFHIISFINTKFNYE